MDPRLLQPVPYSSCMLDKARYQAKRRDHRIRMNITRGHLVTRTFKVLPVTSLFERLLFLISRHFDIEAF